MVRNILIQQQPDAQRARPFRLQSGAASELMTTIFSSFESVMCGLSGAIPLK
jgi:hypothetical protein